MWKNLHGWKFVCMLSAQKWKDEFFPSSSHCYCYFFVMCEFFFILPLILFENCLHGYNLSLSSIINQDRRGERENVSRVPRNYVWNLITMCKFPSFRFSLHSSIFIAVKPSCTFAASAFVRSYSQCIFCMLLIPHFVIFFFTKHFSLTSQCHDGEKLVCCAAAVVIEAAWNRSGKYVYVYTTLSRENNKKR